MRTDAHALDVILSKYGMDDGRYGRYGKVEVSRPSPKMIKQVRVGVA